MFTFTQELLPLKAIIYIIINYIQKVNVRIYYLYIYMELSDKNIPSNGTHQYLLTILLHTSFIEETETKLQVQCWMLIQFCKDIIKGNLHCTFIRESQPTQNLMLKCLCFDNQCVCLILPIKIKSLWFHLMHFKMYQIFLGTLLLDSFEAGIAICHFDVILDTTIGHNN